MDRQIVYIGSVPTDTDHLQQSRNTMIALGYLIKMMVGDDQSYADGLACTPGVGLQVEIAAGSLAAPTVVDAEYYGTLPPDGSPLVKLGIKTTSTSLSIPGAGTYLVCGGFQETEGGFQVLPYYNAASPGQTMFGPSGSGTAQGTILQQKVVLQVVAGSTPPSGYLPLWTVVVPDGQAGITQGMISIATGAPFVKVKLPKAAPLDSPDFTGSPTAPSPSTADNSTRLATTAFVNGYVAKSGDIMTGTLQVPAIYQMSTALSVQDPIANAVTGTMLTPGAISAFSTSSYAGAFGISTTDPARAILNFTSSNQNGTSINVGSVSLVVNDGQATGVNFNTTSDYRLKTNVKPIDGHAAITRLSSLRPVSHGWKAAPGAKEVQGFLAHEFGEVYPHALTGKKDAITSGGNPIPQMVDIGKAVPDLTAAVLQLADRLTRMESAVSALSDIIERSGTPR